MQIVRYALAATLFLTLTAPALAAPECQMRVLRPVTDDVGNSWQPGKVLPATIMRRQTGQTFFCSHGGSCVPRMVDGKQTARLIHCRPGSALGNGDYSLVPVP